MPAPSRPDPAAEQRKVDAWNASQPVGSPVTVRRDNGNLLETKTRSEAWVLPAGVAVVMVSGISGAYMLDRVSPLNLASA